MKIFSQAAFSVTTVDAEQQTDDLVGLQLNGDIHDDERYIMKAYSAREDSVTRNDNKEEDRDYMGVYQRHFIMDSGATRHMSGTKEDFISMQPCSRRIIIANNKEIILELALSVLLSRTKTRRTLGSTFQNLFMYQR